MFLNPERLDGRQQLVVDEWLRANGCRDHVDLVPVVIAGNWIHYSAICRRDPKSVRRLKEGRYVIDKIDQLPDGSFRVHDRYVGATPRRRRKLRIRVPVACLVAGLNSEKVG